MNNQEKHIAASWLIIVSFLLLCLVGIPSDISGAARHNELMSSWNSLSVDTREELDQSYSCYPQSTDSSDPYYEEWQEWKGSRDGYLPFSSLMLAFGLGYGVYVKQTTPRTRRKRRTQTQAARSRAAYR